MYMFHDFPRFLMLLNGFCQKQCSGISILPRFRCKIRGRVDSNNRSAGVNREYMTTRSHLDRMPGRIKRINRINGQIYCLLLLLLCFSIVVITGVAVVVLVAWRSSRQVQRRFTWGHCCKRKKDEFKPYKKSKIDVISIFNRSMSKLSIPITEVDLSKFLKFVTRPRLCSYRIVNIDVQCAWLMNTVIIQHILHELKQLTYIYPLQIGINTFCNDDTTRGPKSENCNSSKLVVRL